MSFLRSVQINASINDCQIKFDTSELYQMQVISFDITNTRE